MKCSLQLGKGHWRNLVPTCEVFAQYLDDPGHSDDVHSADSQPGLRGYDQQVCIDFAAVSILAKLLAQEL